MALQIDEIDFALVYPLRCSSTLTVHKQATFQKQSAMIQGHFQRQNVQWLNMVLLSSTGIRDH